MILGLFIRVQFELLLLRPTCVAQIATKERASFASAHFQEILLELGGGSADAGSSYS